MKPIEIKGIKIKPNYLRLEYNPNLKVRARGLRKARNFPEVVFWMQVNKGQFHGIDFDRQRIIGNFIVDFYIKSLGLVIEIDGDSHLIKEEYDQKREAYLISVGCKIIHFPAYLAEDHPAVVLRHIENFILENYERVE